MTVDDLSALERKQYLAAHAVSSAAMLRFLAAAQERLAERWERSGNPAAVDFRGEAAHMRREADRIELQGLGGGQ